MRRALLVAAVVALTGCGTYVRFPGRSAVDVVDAPHSQRSIDRGNVVNWNGCQPGQCTVWLAGHRSTHGSVFAAVTSLRAGDPIDYIREGVTYHYVVVDIEDRCCSGDGVEYQPWADLMLQTSLSGGSVRLVHAVRAP